MFSLLKRYKVYILSWIWYEIYPIYLENMIEYILSPVYIIFLLWQIYIAPEYLLFYISLHKIKIQLPEELLTMDYNKLKNFKAVLIKV